MRYELKLYGAKNALPARDVERNKKKHSPLTNTFKTF